MAVLDVPPGFGAALARGETASVQLQIDASNSVQGFLTAVDATQIMARFGLESSARRLGLSSSGTIDGPVIDNRTRVGSTRTTPGSWAFPNCSTW